MAITQVFPFIFHKGINIRFTRKNTAGTIKDFRIMFEKNFLDEKDTTILLNLQKYIYLNAFLLRTLLNRQIECNAEFCNSRLKKLEKLGFVIRFQFYYSDENNMEHATPFVYCLSSSARKIFPIKEDKSFNDNMIDIDCIQRRLSFNQFHIMLEKQYENALQYSSYIFSNEYDGIYKMQSSGKPVIFYVISIRSTEGWGKKYLDKLRCFNNQVTIAKISYSGLIIICENEMQAIKAERSRSGDKEIKDLDIYYITDYAAVAEGSLLQHVIYVKPEDNFSNYDTLSINIDGPIKENVTDIE